MRFKIQKILLSRPSYLFENTGHCPDLTVPCFLLQTRDSPVSAVCLKIRDIGLSRLSCVFSLKTRDSPVHTFDISQFRRELPIWSLSSWSQAPETKPPDERFFQCHFSQTVFQSEHFIFYGSIYLANKLFTASKVSDIYRSN